MPTLRIEWESDGEPNEGSIASHSGTREEPKSVNLLSTNLVNTSTSLNRFTPLTL